MPAGDDSSPSPSPRLGQLAAATMRPQHEADRALGDPDLDRDLLLRLPLIAQLDDPDDHALVDLRRRACHAPHGFDIVLHQLQDEVACGQENDMAVPRVTRSSQGLVDALFETLDQLNAKKVTPEEARAVSHTARSIVAVAHFELQARQLEGGPGQIHSLMIDVTPSRDAAHPQT